MVFRILYFCEMRLVLIAFIFLLNTVGGSAQNVFADSLNRRLQNSKISISERMKILEILIENYRNDSRYDKATTANQKLIDLSKSQNNDLELCKAYVYQGVIFNNQNDYENDRKYLNLAQQVVGNFDNPLAAAYTDYLEAYILHSYNDAEGAIKMFQKALSGSENTDDEILKTKIYYGLYSIYTDWNDMGNTFLYADKAVESAKKSGDNNLLSNAYSALAVAYTYRYDSLGHREDLDKVFEFCERSVELNHRFKGQISAQTFAIAKLNIASYYFKYYPQKKSFIKQQILEALEAAKTANKNPVVTANCYGMLSEMAQDEGDFDKAENYLLTAYNVLLTESPIYLHTTINICEALAALYDKINQPKKAFRFQKLTTDYSKRLFNEEQATASKRLEAQYRFENKEQELQTLKERAENQRKQKLLYIILGIAGFLGAFFMFRSYHFKLKYSMEREKQLANEKSEAELQVKFEKEERSRLKAEQELLTLKQEKLQNEVMANQLHIQHKNEVLKQLKDKLKDDRSLNINQIIREENLLDNDFEKVKFQIQELHPDFFKTLSEKAVQNLTALDLKYCAYFYLGMDTKQIANVLNVEPKSVRMTKYRLRQKFDLETGTDLIGYLKSIV